MKRLIIIILVAVCAAGLYSCGKEDLKYSKMPDNGNASFNCGQPAK